LRFGGVNKLAVLRAANAILEKEKVHSEVRARRVAFEESANPRRALVSGCALDLRPDGKKCARYVPKLE
jgi:hypothetical protein